jgi:hypothetical protein
MNYECHHPSGVVGDFVTTIEILGLVTSSRANGKQ